MERNRAFYITTGFNAYRLGKTSFDCPFPGKSAEGRAWLEGYASAKKINAPRFEVAPMIIRRPIASRVQP